LQESIEGCFPGPILLEEIGKALAGGQRCFQANGHIGDKPEAPEQVDRRVRGNTQVPGGLLLGGDDLGSNKPGMADQAALAQDVGKPVQGAGNARDAWIGDEDPPAMHDLHHSLSLKDAQRLADCAAAHFQVFHQPVDRRQLLARLIAFRPDHLQKIGHHLVCQAVPVS